MRLIGRLGFFVAVVLAAAAVAIPAGAEATLRCGPFTSDVLAAPEPREAPAMVRRFENLSVAVKTQPYRVLFFGDSITQRFDPQIWQSDMAPRGVFNAGINGDRTENLLWRLQHGNLDGHPPEAVVMLIGTNDLTNGGAGRPPEVAAEGIRANLLYLRQRLPNVPVLLLGLWPRAASPDARMRRAVEAVNRLIKTCGDGHMVVYADIGGALLDPDGRLSQAISPDLLHFTHKGYARLAPRLDALIDKTLAGR
ncbi:MAG TPA: GDSL-type esterase/lipase family protein [Stellaceae bacterium]|jgi:beta-glucosidase|nr:GDSL-type esterase/lipase family protein [Stellaceae bacterium]